MSAEEIRDVVKDAVKEAVAEHHRAGCITFSEKERVALHTLSEVDPNVLAALARMYSSATSSIIKGAVIVAFCVAVVLAAIGMLFKLPGSGS